MSDWRTFLAALTAALALSASAGDALRDPMQPYREKTAPVAHAPDYRVSAICVSKLRRVAIVNGHSVAVGDRVDGALVTTIGERAVTLAKDGRTISAQLTTARIRE